MTRERAQLETSEDILRAKNILFVRQNGKCFICGGPISLFPGCVTHYIDKNGKKRTKPIPIAVLAHKIPQDQIDKYGKEVIHHIDNMHLVDCHTCNDLVSISNHPVQCDELAESIREKLKEEGK